MSDLTDNQLYELFLRLRSGENAKAISRYIREAWGVNPESSVHSLSQGILKFQKRIAHLLVTPTTQEEDRCSGPFTGDSAPESTLDALDEIATLQRNRIRDMLAEEKKTGIRYPHINRELQSLANLERQILKAKAFELYHGDPLKRRKLEKIEGKIKHRFGEWMQQTSEDDRLRIANAIQKFLDSIEQYAAPAEIGPDGKWRLVTFYCLSCDDQDLYLDMWSAPGKLDHP